MTMGWSALTGGLAMVMSATPSAPTSMVTRIDPAAMAPACSLDQGERGNGAESGGERGDERASSWFMITLLNATELKT